MNSDWTLVWGKNKIGPGDLGSIPGSRRSPGGRQGNPLQYSCLENPHGQRVPSVGTPDGEDPVSRAGEGWDLPPRLCCASIE